MKRPLGKAAPDVARTAMADGAAIDADASSPATPSIGDPAASASNGTTLPPGTAAVDGAAGKVVTTQATKTLDTVCTADPPPGDKADEKDASDFAKGDPNSPQGACQTQPAAPSTQPVAAAVVLNTAADAATAADAQSGTGLQAPSRVKAAGVQSESQNAAAGSKTIESNGADAQPAGGNKTAEVPPPHDAQRPNPQPQAPAQTSQQASGQAQGRNQSQSSAQTQTSNDTAATAATVATDQPAAGDRVSSALQNLTANGAAANGAGSAARAGPDASNANVLPNFGFIPTNTAATATGTQPAASGTAVPVSGLAVTIAAHAQAGSNRFDIRLDPPELGRIDVRLSVDGSGQVTSHVTVDRADTLQLLQNHQPQLEHALEQAGLKTADNGLQFTLRDQSFSGQNGGNSGYQPSAAQFVIPDAELAPIEATQIYSRAGSGSGLDIRV